MSTIELRSNRFPSALSRVLIVVALGVAAAVLVVAVLQFSRKSGQRIGESLVKVGPSDDLQDTLDDARPGDTIVLEAGKVYRGPFTLPKKAGSSFITIQSSRAAELPEGTRVGPAQAALLPKLVSANVEPVIKTAPGAHHYRFVGIEISTATEKDKIYDLVRLGESKQTAADVPHDLLIDRSWIHGWPTQDVQRGISLNGAEITISNSSITEIHGRGYDTQAICGWNGPGPFHIINNYLEASGENILFGGADPSITDLVPSNIEIRGNHLFKPLSWKVGHATYGGIHWTIKNLLELKMGRNVVIDGNVLENCWGDAQIGYAVLFTVRNQSGKAPWAILENVTFTNNIIKNSEQGLQLLGKDSPNVSQQSSGLRITNNLFTGISNRFLTMNGYHNVTLSHNTHFQNGNIMTLHGKVSNGFVYTNNITNRAAKGYGIHGDGVGEGTAALTRWAPEADVRGNLFIGAQARFYPPQNAFPGSVDEVKFVDFEGGNFRLSPQSRFKRTASDRGDPGCQIDVLPQQKSN